MTLSACWCGEHLQKWCQAVMADEDRVLVLRESLAAATFRIEGPLNKVKQI